MEVLRWKGNREIFCHSPPFSCSSVTSMLLSGRGEKKTACQTMLFYNVWYSKSSQLVSLIIMLEHSISMPHCFVLHVSLNQSNNEEIINCSVFLRMWLKYKSFSIHPIHMSNGRLLKPFHLLLPHPASCHAQKSYQQPLTASLNFTTTRPWISWVITSNDYVCARGSNSWDILFQLNLYWKHK